VGYAWDLANCGSLAFKAVGVGIAAKQALTADSVILGRWDDGLQAAAKAMDATYLNVYPKVPYLYSWTANRYFLAIAESRNIPIYFASDTGLIYNSAKGFGKELFWLIDKGYYHLLRYP